LSGSSFGRKSGRFLAEWFKMNWVLENLDQGTSSGLEYKLLEFKEQANYASFFRTK
jgi:hypothetical protein